MLFFVPNSKVEMHNLAVSSKFQSSASNRHRRMDGLLEARMDTQSKMSEGIKRSRDEIIKIGEDHTQTAVETWEMTDAQIKQTMTDLDGIAADNLQSEQRFLSSTLDQAQSFKNDQTAQLQNHLTQHLDTVLKMENEIKRLRTLNERLEQEQKQYVCEQNYFNKTVYVIYSFWF